MQRLKLWRETKIFLSETIILCFVEQPRNLLCSRCCAAVPVCWLQILWIYENWHFCVLRWFVCNKKCDYCWYCSHKICRCMIINFISGLRPRILRQGLKILINNSRFSVDWTGQINPPELKPLSVDIIGILNMESTRTRTEQPQK